mgnify:CR=1 FL=1
MEMILTAKIINAEEGYRIGLINHVVDTEKLLAKCLEIANLFTKTSPEALTAAIKSINCCYSNNSNWLLDIF